ncbi:MAG: phosphatase PAP2 family protein [Anaerolineales bacterium]
MLVPSGPSFPSGPAVLAVLCYGLLAYVLIPNLQSPFWRWVIAFLSASAVIVTGLSSLLFGTHYFIDVIAGYALGLAWTGFVYTLAEKIFQNRLSAEQIKWHPISLSGLRLLVFFKKRPLLGLVLILFSALILALLGYNILTEGPLTQLDMIVYKGLLAQAKAASPVLNDIMLFGFFVGKQSVQLIVMLLSLYFLYQRYWLELLTIQVSAQGGGILWNFLIGYFSRPRPSEQLAFVTNTIPSFPSGHTLGAMICYGFLAYLLIPKMPSFFWKWFLSFFLLAILLFEGFTRMFHGNHYLTDVLAGYALGIFWLVLVCTLMENIFVQEQKE